MLIFFVKLWLGGEREKEKEEIFFFYFLVFEDVLIKVCMFIFIYLF